MYLIFELAQMNKGNWLMTMNHRLFINKIRVLRLYDLQISAARQVFPYHRLLILDNFWQKRHTLEYLQIILFYAWSISASPASEIGSESLRIRSATFSNTMRSIFYVGM